MTPLPLLRLNPRTNPKRKEISADAFCVIVDDFLEAPHLLVDFARQNQASFSHPNIGFPGKQLRIDDAAMKDVLRFVRSKLSKPYSFMRGLIGIRSLLSLVTLPPARLSFMQRVCHIDPNPDPGRNKYAALIYLFDDERLGGTSFFRWRDEALVWQGVDLLHRNRDEGEDFLRQRFETFRGRSQYMTASNEIAELLCTVSPKFNRFVFYPGDIPHSGSITAPELLSDDPASGRLTLNLFFSALPK